jgi:hypothetical protein
MSSTLGIGNNDRCEAAFLCYLCEVVQDRLVVTHRRGQHRPAVACR